MVLEQEKPMFEAVVVHIIGKKLEDTCHDDLGEI